VEYDIMGYFVTADSATGNIKLKSHDNDEHDIFKRSSTNICTISSLGIQNVVYIDKYQVDTLGNRNKIRQEKRIMTQKKKK